MEIHGFPLLSPPLPEPAGAAATAPRQAIAPVAAPAQEPTRRGGAAAEAATEERTLDYGELIRRARVQDAGRERFMPLPEAPLRARQALSAYAANAAAPEVELMPRVDDFV